MAVGEFALQQALIRAAQTLEHIRVICDRTHEESVLAERDGRELECHYAFALGTVMAVALQELTTLQQLGLIRRAEDHEEANARAQASLEAFKRSVRALEPQS